jgi:hypothetical protein
MLGRYWQVAIMALLAIVIGVQHLEIKHYKTSAEDAKQELVTYKHHAEANYEAWKSSNAALTLQAKQASATILTMLSSKTVSNRIQEIKNDPIAKGITVPATVVRLFNESTRDSTSQGTTTTIPSDAQDSTVAELASVCAANASEQIILYHQVVEWQSFWSEYAKGVASVNSE